MCGIAGIVYSDGNRPINQAMLKGMADSIAHRGPDAEGFWSASGVGLAHRRLSIIDLQSGNQPIANEDDSIQVVFNGEIYNYREIRSLLEARGHRFRTNSDTEVLVHLYEDDSEQLVTRLRGMFAFALWDRRQRRLLIARDRLGIKPLYFYRDAEKFLFASELKALLVDPTVPRHIDPSALEDYIAFGMVPGRKSIFCGFEKLLPAHTLTIGPDYWNQPPRRYWSLQFQSDEQTTMAEWQEQIRAKIDDAVRSHLIADVPVGAFLSGGIDSSVVVASASSSLNRSLQTYSIGFREAAFSELPAARRTSEFFGTKHFEEIVTPDAIQLLDQITYYFDEPFADSSAIPTLLLARLARQNLKVALSGDGGDEAFGGYTRYAHDMRESAIRRRLPRCVQQGLAPFARHWPKADWLPRILRAKTLLTNLSLNAGAAYANTLQLCRAPQRRRLLAPDVLAALNGHRPEDHVTTPYSAAPPDDALAGMISADVATLLPDDYLVKVDRASMAYGLEVRPPLLDHELLELSARIPSRWKIHKNETKWLLKQAWRDRLPPGTIDRPKQGFEIPIDDWFKGPLSELFQESVLLANAACSNLINQAAARSLFKSHQAGFGRHGNVLWSLLVLARWYDRYVHSGVEKPLVDK